MDINVETEAALRNAFQRIEELERHLAMAQHQQQQQQQPRGDGFRPRKPSTFSGERWDSNAVEAWIQEVETYFFLSGIAEARKAVVAASFFTGPAALWWRMRVPGGEGAGLARVEPWEDLRQAIRQHFKPARAEANARDRLARLRQKGRVTTYVMRFRELIVQIPTMSEDEKLHRFLEGLTDLRMRRELDYRQPTNWQGAVEQALRYDSLYNYDRRDVAQPAVRPMAEGPPRQGDAMELGAARADAPQQAAGSRKCFRCGDPNHLVRNCPQRRTMPTRQEN